MRLLGKVALVTGAADTRSIGWGIARALASEGVDVIINDIAPPELGWASGRLADLAALGRRGLAIQADVSDAAAVDAMFAQAVETFGRIDIVASNAGIIRWERFLELTRANTRAIINVNIKGMVNVCRAAAQRMITQGGGGRIILTSSVQADMHFPITPIYGGTKHAMHALVGSLALELAAHNITVNHIGPGWVRSALNDPAPDQQTPDAVEGSRQSIPLRRDGRIDEMGRAVVYLASDDSAYTTGAFLRIDGGLGIGKYWR